ncbi:tRNA synthetases class I-domain-containing protein [Collybia nuda]|uniref:Isoleucine--tRNA ligase, mitochondrial n=1 Tax=Collybia nuda TaxID=64659 RepID=A0A9P6CG81_9AGAR|nr:tRNA synthetases class I-domain-containing protein [Collybia nuda]
MRLNRAHHAFTFYPFRYPQSRRTFSSSIRTNSQEQPGDNKSFSNTLHLPKTSFPLWTDPSKSEIPFRERTGEDLYRWQWNNAKGPLFVFHDGPPYANGNLHIGHALNKILKDIVNRYHVSLGHKVHYIPGWDCHGLPIENKALQELNQDSLTASPTTIRDAAEATAKREIESQKAQFRHFGIMADWSSEFTYRTLDRGYELRQLRIFQKMVEKGLIYRHYRPVHYSPSSRSALAEAELVYKDDHVSHSVYVSFEIDRNAEIKSPLVKALVASSTSTQLLVWTTTPWTLTANMGIAVHQELTYSVLRRKDQVDSLVVVVKDRMEALTGILGGVETVAEISGSDLVDVQYVPIFSSLSPASNSLKIISAPHVTSESGTGLVHCAPAHGAEDYQAFLALGLISNTNNMICHVDKEGKFTTDVAEIVGEHAGNLIGQEVLTGGSKAVVDILRNIGALVKIQRIKHRYPYDWKTDRPIIVTATSQWFANLANIKEDALKALSDVSFFPALSRNRLESFIRSRSEWCISRQRVWGVPIPALHRLDSGRSVLDLTSLNHILTVLEKRGVAYWWNGPVEDFVHPSLLEPGRSASETWEKGTDTMDVWFDSGTSWSMLSEMGVGNENEGRSFHADVCLEGSDQHRGWFQSQLLTAIGSASTPKENISPYGTLITHGMVLDEAGKKMSKSLGNIVSPLTVVLGGEDKKKNPVYGADVLRLWVATVEYWRDMSIGPTVLAQAAESMRKIRNSARFALGNIGDEGTRSQLKRVPRGEMGLAERYVMHELYNLERTALDGYSTYNFPKVINALTNFANITLSSLYFDITKDCLYANGITSHERRAVVTVLEQVLRTMTSVLAPVLPHLAEEIHDAYKSDGLSVFMTPWTPLSNDWMDPQAAEDMAELLQVRGTVLSLLEKARRDKRLKSSLEAEVDIVLPSVSSETKLGKLLQREENFLKTLFITSDAIVTDEGSFGTSSADWVYSGTIAIPGVVDDLAVRVRPSTLQKCPRCWTYTKPETDTLCERCAQVIPH